MPERSKFQLPKDVMEKATRTRTLLRDVVDRMAPPLVFCGHWHQRLIHELQHPTGVVSRVDVLGMEGNRAGNGVLLRPGEASPQVEPLLIHNRT